MLSLLVSGSIGSLVLANKVDFGIVYLVQQHQRDDGHRAILSYFSRFVKAALYGCHPAQVYPLGEAECCAFCAEAGQSVDPVMAIAAEFAAAGVAQQVDIRREFRVKTEDGLDFGIQLRHL